MVNQYDIYLVKLNPTQGSEINKTRPCVIISPNELHHLVNTVIIAPMTSKSHNLPTRIKTTFEKKTGEIALDQIRTIDSSRLVKQLGKLKPKNIQEIKKLLHEMLVA